MQRPQSPDCSFCAIEDSISHFFLKCDKAQQFWCSLHLWCESHLDISIPQLSVTEMLLRITRSINARKLVNWIILPAKFFIHRNKLFHDYNLSLIAFLAEMCAKIYRTAGLPMGEQGIRAMFLYIQRSYL